MSARKRILSVLGPGVVALGLAYSAALPVAAQEQRAAAAGEPAPLGNSERGARLYVDRACWQCHGLAAQGGGIAGPRLAGRVQVWPVFAQYVRRPAEEMIPYTTRVLPDQELADIFAWLKALPQPPSVESTPIARFPSPQRRP